jgi:hypothetical protein
MTPSEVPFDAATIRERIRAFRASDEPAMLVIRTKAGRTFSIRDPLAIGLSVSDRHLLVRDEGEDFDEILRIGVHDVVSCELRPRPPDRAAAVVVVLVAGALAVAALALALTLLIR